MAEEDAEIALLRQLQAGQENMAWDNNGASEASSEPSNTEDKNQEEKKQSDEAQVQRAISPSGSVIAVSDGDSYDPSSLPSLHIPALIIAGDEQSRSSSRASSRKRKVVGGFLADDSDDEETATPSAPGLQVSGAVTTNRTLSPSPLQTSLQEEDVIASPAEPGNSNTGAIPPIASSVTVPAPPTSAITQPKARLPHDKIGILEDRIAEDPRGDIDAWLSLVSEYRGTSN